MSAQLGLDLRDRGLDSVEGNSMTFQDRMRAEAIRISNARGWVTSDDLREYADREGIEPHHPNAWGAVFRGKCWVTVGIANSTVPTNHARLIRRWAYKEQ